MLEKLSVKTGGAYSLKLLRLVAALVPCVLLLALALLLPQGLLRHRFDMVWNVFLSALPLAFALALYRRRQLGRRGALNIVLALLWLAFFPNAPYMVTDLIHLDNYVFWADGRFVPSPLAWLGLAHIVLAVTTGLLCGCLSLYHIHILSRGRKKWHGWAFCAAVCLLAGIGIYIGRFLRFNSWDIFHRPLALLAGLAETTWWHTLLLCLLFAGLTFGGYLLFYACYHSPAAATSKQTQEE